MSTLAAIDHLIYTCADLKQGMDEVERLLGTRPVIGGRHPAFGTCNAVIGLGEGKYLEVIAPDPELPAPEQGVLFEKAYTEPPHLETWVMKANGIENQVKWAFNNGFDLGKVSEGRREQDDGKVLQWKLSDPFAFAIDGAIPFIIDWGNTPHPSITLPSAGDLIELTIEHPKPDVIAQLYRELGIQINVTQGRNIKVKARVRTKDGIKDFE